MKHIFSGYLSHVRTQAFGLSALIGHDPIAFSPHAEHCLFITVHPEFRCCHCEKKTRTLYAQAYCFLCFRQLARCDLCFVSPTRCHYAQGTCREPEFGRSYCMTPHVVYLSWTSDIKVGLTRQGRLHERLKEQGALMAAPIAETMDRREAGQFEALLRERMSDRTDWRKMLQTHTVDPFAFEDHFQEAVTHLRQSLGFEAMPYQPLEFSYPILGSVIPKTLHQKTYYEINAPLIGVKGMYLIFPSGVISLRQWQGRYLEIKSTLCAPPNTNSC